MNDKGSRAEKCVGKALEKEEKEEGEESVRQNSFTGIQAVE